MKIVSQPEKDSWKSILARPTQSLASLEPIVDEIFKEIAQKGDQAVLKYTRLFDGVEPQALELDTVTWQKEAEMISDELKTAIQKARENVDKFHRAQQTGEIAVETTSGVHCWQRKLPIERIGLYIPGGSAPLFSTVLMLAVPAAIAGCKEVILCSPPDREGKIHPAVLYAAKICGVHRVFTMGGIQAIAAMTFGTQSVPGVYKIFGPGNQYVTAAKQLAMRHGVAIDMPAGPSEVMVVADDSAKPEFVAADLLSQAEHGADSQVVLVTTSQALAEKVSTCIEDQLRSLPRKAIAEKAMAHSTVIVVSNRETAVEILNYYAPEHLILSVNDEDWFLDRIVNAGSVFIGNYTPESAGDYASGTNHTLPTNGFAKMYSGVNLDSYQKSISFQRISPEGLKNLGPVIECMAEAEGLMAHKLAVSIRLKELNKQKQDI